MSKSSRGKSRVNRFKRFDVTGHPPQGFWTARGIVDVRVFFAGKFHEPGRKSEDAFFCDVEHGVIAISDGASTSYRADLWSTLIVKQLVTNPEVEFDEIDWKSLSEQVQSRYPSNEPAFLRPLQLAGSAATALRVVLQREEDGWRVSSESLGDSLLILVEEGADSGTGVISWPFSSLDEFPIAPPAFASSPPYRRGGESNVATFFCDKGDRLLLMTDALGRYFCRVEGHSFGVDETFSFLKSPTMFREWSTREIGSGRLEDDDLTLVEVRIL